MATWGLSQGISLGHYLATLTVFISKTADWGVGENVISLVFNLIVPCGGFIYLLPV